MNLLKANSRLRSSLNGIKQRRRSRQRNTMTQSSLPMPLRGSIDIEQNKSGQSIETSSAGEILLKQDLEVKFMRDIYLEDDTVETVPKETMMS